MDRSLIKQAFAGHREAGGTTVGGSGGAPKMSSLPPTRAARLARSRGAFFARHRLAGLARWLGCAVSVALTAIAIAATAPRVIEAPAVLLNPGPALVAATSMLPAMFAPRH
jgi:hypothetical protein